MYSAKSVSSLISSITQTGHNNAAGLRTKKEYTIGGTTTTTEYTLHGSQIMHLKQGDNELHFHYDAQCRPSHVTFNGVMNVYVYNLQGDVITIRSGGASDTNVFKYRYDAWAGLPAARARYTTRSACLTHSDITGMSLTRRRGCTTSGVGIITRLGEGS